MHEQSSSMGNDMKIADRNNPGMFGLGRLETSTSGEAAVSGYVIRSFTAVTLNEQAGISIASRSAI